MFNSPSDDEARPNTKTETQSFQEKKTGFNSYNNKNNNEATPPSLKIEWLQITLLTKENATEGKHVCYNCNPIGCDEASKKPTLYVKKNSTGNWYARCWECNTYSYLNVVPYKKYQSDGRGN